MHSNGRGLPHLFRVRNPLPDCTLKLHPVIVKKGGVQTSDEVPLYGAAFTNPLGCIFAKPFFCHPVAIGGPGAGGARIQNVERPGGGLRPPPPIGDRRDNPRVCRVASTPAGRKRARPPNRAHRSPRTVHLGHVNDGTCAKRLGAARPVPYTQPVTICDARRGAEIHSAAVCPDRD